MSKWENFKKGFSNLADKTVNKTKELTDTAALKIKIANKESERDSEYKKLGKLTYAKLKKLDGRNPDVVTKEISEILENLDEINYEIYKLKAEEKAKKEAKKAEKQSKEVKVDTDEELNLDVMNSFNQARDEAEAEYQKAKQASDEAEKQ